MSGSANQIPASEASVIETMVQAVLDKQRNEHKAGTLARRDVHAKSHGAIELEFRVLSEVPKVGIFAEPRTYRGIARFSNGAFGPTGADIFPNIRGIAIKLYGVPGTKALFGEETVEEHDFLMANHPTFFVPRIENMLALTQGKMKDLARQCPKALWYMFRSMVKLVKNPLEISYFSQVPYRFDTAACKYALVPEHGSSLFSLPKMFDRDYMRHAIERRLRNGPVKFTFCVQVQRPGESIEDSTQPWRGTWIPVAEVTFLQSQRPIPEADGEALSFNPWRALEVHEPMGWPGRTRRAVYKADFAWRTEQNAKPAN